MWWSSKEWPNGHILGPLAVHDLSLCIFDITGIVSHITSKDKLYTNDLWASYMYVVQGIEGGEGGGGRGGGEGGERGICRRSSVLWYKFTWCWEYAHRYNEEEKGGLETERRKRSDCPPPPLLITSMRLFTIPQASTINRQLADRIDSCVLPRQQGFPGQYPQFTTANLLYNSVLGRRLLRARLVVRGKKKVSLDTTGLYSSY